MDDADFDIWNLIGLLRRQARLIIITLVVVVGITGLVVFTLTPIFQASSLVLVDTSDKNLLDPNRDLSGSATDAARLQSELEIMQSDAIMLKVIERENLLRDEEFGVKLGLVERVMAFLQLSQPTLPSGDLALRRVLYQVKAATSASQVGLSNLISMSVRSKSPDRAAEIANAWSAAYIEEQVSAKIDSTLAARNVLQSRLAQARGALVAAEDSLDGYIDTNLSEIVGKTGRSDIADVRTTLQTVVAERNLNTTRVADAEASLAQRNWEQLTKTLQSDAVRELESQREQLATTLTSAAEGPAVNLRAALADIETRLTDAATKEVASLRQSVAEGQSSEATLRQRLRTAVLSSALPADMLSQIYELQQNAELGRQQYQALLSRTQDLDTQASLQIADSRVVSPALAPDKSSYPNTPLSLASAIAAALALGLAFAFLREHLLGGLLTEGQTEAVLKIPVAAAIPRTRVPASRARSDGLVNLMVDAPLSPFPEAIRRIKVTIDQVLGRLTPQSMRRAPEHGVIVMVTSSTANEGKSTVALSLARAFATAHRSVALIDCDFRKPSIQRMSGLPATDGLDRLLRGEHDVLHDAGSVEASTGGELLIIAGSKPSNVPTDHLITSRAFAKMVEDARSHCEVVVLDTPPVGPVTDGLYLAGMADIIVFVVRSGTTSQTEARSALGSIRAAAGPDTRLVAVLNQQAAASAQYKSQYGYYSSGAASD